MAEREMILKLSIGMTFLVASVHCAAALTAVAATDPLDNAAAEDARPGSPSASAIWEQPAARVPVQVVTAPAVPAPAPERVLSANPLWGIPLSALSGTRDRPIFSSSRRPPALAVAPAAAPKLLAAAPPKPREPERPPLSLVGTIAGGDEGFGIFLDQSTRSALRLRIGEDYQGWKLRSVQGREATVEKDQQAVTLALPQPGPAQPGLAQPGLAQAASELRPPPATAGKLLSVPSDPRPNRAGR
jgi:general secretion pathway protein N